MLTLVRAVGALSLLTFVFIILMIFVAPRLAPEDEQRLTGDGRDAPVLAIEFMQTAQVEGFLGERDPDGDSAMRRKIRRGLGWDNLFIADYWLLFVGLSAVLSRRAARVGAPREGAGEERPRLSGLTRAPWLTVFAALCATGGAISDTVENARTLVLLDAAKVTKPLHDSLAAASFEKWLLIGLATLALAFAFIRTDGAKSLLVSGVLFLLYFAAGVLTLWGLSAGGQGPFAAVFGLNLLGSLVVGLLFTFGSGWVSERL